LNDNNHSRTRSRRCSHEGNARAERAPDSPIAVLLEAAGHSRDCIVRVRSGWVGACSREGHMRSCDDAAMAIGLAIRFARIGAAHGVPIPTGVLAPLVERVDAGNPAAVLVWKWLAGRGQVPARARKRPKLRLVKGEAR